MQVNGNCTDGCALLQAMEPVSALSKSIILHIKKDTNIGYMDLKVLEGCGSAQANGTSLGRYILC